MFYNLGARSISASTGSNSSYKFLLWQVCSNKFSDIVCYGQKVEIVLTLTLDLCDTAFLYFEAIIVTNSVKYESKHDVRGGELY